YSGAFMDILSSGKGGDKVSIESVSCARETDIKAIASRTKNNLLPIFLPSQVLYFFIHILTVCYFFCCLINNSRHQYRKHIIHNIEQHQQSSPNRCKHAPRHAVKKGIFKSDRVVSDNPNNKRRY